MTNCYSICIIMNKGPIKELITINKTMTIIIDRASCLAFEIEKKLGRNLREDERAFVDWLAEKYKEEKLGTHLK
ncbi:hypothetical protein [Scopulibacillus cellulosilyticus]|uniref:Uncharacterized protein n=1 Tax=Scopulibacillus cellulosilyticus TaxID=2665665 RepID=A0ABW2PYC6_9BACL